MSYQRQELRDRLVAALSGTLEPEQVRAAIAAIMPLFPRVEDDWDEIVDTRLCQAGETVIHQRWLVARIPVQSIRYERPRRVPDRSVNVD